MIVVFFFLAVTLIYISIAMKLFEPKFKVRRRIDVFVNSPRDNVKEQEEENKSAVNTIVMQFRNIVTDYLGKRISSEKEINLERKLLKAGNPMGITVIGFQGFKLGLKIVLPIIFIAYGKLLRIGSIGVLALGLLGLVMAIVIPDFYLDGKMKKRYKQALKELPDFLDLLTVCLEAGLGFDGALNKVISKSNGVLAFEFHICIEEIRLGKTRKEGLTGVKERLDFDEMKALINSILQAEKLGISIVQILRIKSREQRQRRKQRAEEEAMKAPIKILFPLVLFIFPSIFTVLLGPAIIQLITQLGK